MLHDIYSKEKTSKKEIKKEKIIIDYRERNSLVPSKIKKLGIDFEFKQLKVGDYLVKDIIIERKTFTDFFKSMINGHLKKQLEEMKQYDNKILVIEKTSEFSNSMKGFILSITLNHKIPIIFTKGEEETAEYIKILSKRQKKIQKINPSKKTFSTNERLNYILQSFPKIGPKKSKSLLEEFKTLTKIFNSKENELKEILGKNSREFIGLLNTKFKEKGLN